MPKQVGGKTESAVAGRRKPMVSTRRVSLFEREIRVRLSSPAVEIVFQLGAILSEGQIEDDGYFGSTMITIDLARAIDRVSDPCDAATAQRVTELLAKDQRIRSRAREIAVSEARKRAGCELLSPQVDMRVRCAGAHVHIDLDVEASLQGTAHG